MNKYKEYLKLQCINFGLALMLVSGISLSLTEGGFMRFKVKGKPDRLEVLENKLDKLQKSMNTMIRAQRKTLTKKEARELLAEERDRLNFIHDLDEIVIFEEVNK